MDGPATNDSVSVVSWLDKLYGIVLRKFHFKLQMLPFGAKTDNAPSVTLRYIVQHKLYFDCIS